MKILALTSSYRKRGNTARMVQLVLDRMERLAAAEGESLEVESANLAHLHLEPCRGCRACFDLGEERCPLKDDLQAIKAQIDAADGVILASPVYVEDVNGVMKTLIDRLAYICHRPELFSKCAYVLTTSGVGSSRHSRQTMSTALRTWGAYVVGQATFKTGALMPQEMLVERHAEQAQKVAEALFRSVREQRPARPSFLSLMTFRIQQQYWIKNENADDSLDAAYWKERGWTEPRCDYYAPHEAGRLKVALARVTGALIAPFVI